MESEKDLVFSGYLQKFECKTPSGYLFLRDDTTDSSPVILAQWVLRQFEIFLGFYIIIISGMSPSENLERLCFLCSAAQGKSQPGGDGGLRGGRDRGSRLLLRPPAGRPGGSDPVGTFRAETFRRWQVHGLCRSQVFDFYIIFCSVAICRLDRRYLKLLLKGDSSLVLFLLQTLNTLFLHLFVAQPEFASASVKEILRWEWWKINSKPFTLHISRDFFMASKW